MERHSQRENVSLGHGPKTPFKQSDIDFQDVFGGPPRRSSMQEMRYSLNSTNNSQGEEDSGLALRPRSGGGLNEMPVFGEETVNRRRYASDNFFDDIFRGDESVGSPRRSNQDSFGSIPGSMVMSPAHPMPPRADPYSSSLPAQYQFSLPAKPTKAIDFPVSASSSRSPHRYKDPSSNAITSLYTPTPPLSRLSSEASQEEDGLKNEIRQSYSRSPLSHEFPLSSKELSHENKSGELEDSTDIGSNLKKESKTAEAPNNNGQFHFSIYKWASRGLPLLMPVRGGNNTRSKERLKLERSSSSNGRIQSKNLANGLETTYLPDSGLHFLKQGTNDESPYPEGMEQERALLFKTSTEDIVEEAVLSMAESKAVNKIPNIVKNVPGDTILNDRREEIRTRKGIRTSKEEAKKLELKPLRSLLSDTIDEKGNDEIASRKSEGKEAVEKTAAFGSNASVSKNAKKRVEKRIKPSRVARANELQSPDLRKTSGDNLGKNEAKGKVKEFVQIFSQEAVSIPKIGSETRGQSFRSKSKGTFPADDEESANTAQTNETNHVHGANKMIIPPNVSAVVDKSEKQSPVKTRVFNASENSFRQNDTSAASTESFRDGPKVTDVNVDDLFQDNFMVQELYNDQDKQPQTGDDYEDIKISDAKIRKWLSGKESNIRSLLSTLQYVLWAGSGWKPVPLMDIIEGSAVKRAYQKALLCLHPDKLQQKGAAAHQKYIAEKVFEVLQEAWDHFNSLGAM